MNAARRAGPWVAALALATAAAAEHHEASSLPLSPKLEDALETLGRSEAKLAAEPGSFDAQVRLALSLNQVMAIRTNGNMPLVEGLQDSEANRALWNDLGSRALEHARAALAQRPDSVLAASAVATSYMFYASSLGILRSILQGAGGEYRSNAQRLIDLDPSYDDALGHTLLASLMMIAPWPIGDDDAALEHYQKAAELAPKSVRNQYGLGVYWARDGNGRRARTHFERAASQPCTRNTELLFCDWMKAESKRVLAELGGR